MVRNCLRLGKLEVSNTVVGRLNSYTTNSQVPEASILPNRGDYELYCGSGSPRASSEMSEVKRERVQGWTRGGDSGVRGLLSPLPLRERVCASAGELLYAY